ncbi:hypothetical protein niasHT_002397 [Heterodera trifolii]|uniref:B30.2/SPRY domain-containing protein n=1 Tax=Heterodera trifolii TaxID=157864 RepID=A0ABD2LMC8_9BILA
MSISSASTNSGDFSYDDCEMNYDEFSLVKQGDVVMTNCESFTDRQTLKKLKEKFAKLELVLKITKLELKNKGLQEKLKQQETNALLAKIEAENGKMKNEIEKMQEKIDNKEVQYMDKLEELQKKMLQAKSDAEEENRKLRNAQKEMKEKMDKLEEQLGRKLDEEAKVEKAKMGGHQQQKVPIVQIKYLQNEQKRKMNALKRDQKEKQMKIAILNFQQNYWDANACQNDLEITELTVLCHKEEEYGFSRTVFAIHPILFDKDASGFFYFEISVKAMQHQPFGCIDFGFAIKDQKKLEGTIARNLGTYEYSSYGFFTINGIWMDHQKSDSFKENDIVGCGVNSSTRQIFFTKNGLRQGPFYLVDDSPHSVLGNLFPFVSFFNSGDKIDANFGPNFKFNLATL